MCNKQRLSIASGMFVVLCIIRYHKVDLSLSGSDTVSHSCTHRIPNSQISVWLGLEVCICMGREVERRL